MALQSLLKPLETLSGNLSVWLEDSVSGETASFRPDAPHIAASVIKLAALLTAFEDFESGRLDPNALYTLREEDKVPSCGALTYMHAGLQVSYLDLTTLMIILSDNTATNILADALGLDRINRCLARWGLGEMRFRRKMFDAQAAAQGLQNTVTARSVAAFFRKLLAGELVSPDASRRMLAILGDQRLNGKMPFYLHSMGIDVAHKTGEDDGTTHDAGIIYAAHPVIAVFLSNDTDVPVFERYIQDTARDLAKAGS